MSTRTELDRIETDGLFFLVFTEYDDSASAPWENDCIYDGVVSDWKSDWKYDRRYGRYPRKAPYERILCRDRSDFRTFDVRRFIDVAVSHGCTPQQAHDQIEPAFNRLRQWCNDCWYYIGVIVECWTVNEEGEPDEMLCDDSLWCVESDCDDYIREVYTGMVQGLLRQYHDERTNGRTDGRKHVNSPRVES